MDVLESLHDSEMITQKYGEIPIAEYARPRIPHDIIFAIGGGTLGLPTFSVILLLPSFFHTDQWRARMFRLILNDKLLMAAS
jgi:hypothetical protein